MRKTILGIAALGALALPLALAPAAYAADGDQALNITFEGVSTLEGVGATTDFALTSSYAQASGAGNGDMYDPGVYAIAANPYSLHPSWVDLAGSTDNMLIVNGFTNTDQKVLEVSATGVSCSTPGSTVTYEFGANMLNILPNAPADGGAKITVYINGVAIGNETVLSNEAGNAISITGAAPASNPMTVKIVNNGTAYGGNDFAIDDITLTQRGVCEPPCEATTLGVWHNYAGNFAKTGVDVNQDGKPDLNDPNWKVLPAQPGGQHDMVTRGFNAPYQTGKTGNGDWFYWSNEGHTCVPVVPVI